MIIGGIMRKSVLFLCLLFVLSFNSIFSQNPDINRSIYYLEKEFGDIFIEAIYSIDETKPYAIIQNDHISVIYNNNWISPGKIIKMLSNEDKKNIVDEIINFLKNYEKSSDAILIINKLKSWCITEYQLDFISEKMEVGKKRILLILKDIYSGYINQNTGETVDQMTTKKDEEQEYYILVNYLSGFNLNEQFNIYAKLFNQLAKK